MRKLFLIATVALVTAATPALAQKNGNGNGNGNGHGSGRGDVHRGGMAEMMGNQGMNRGQAKHKKHGANSAHMTRTPQAKHGGRACPPGLAKKSPACMPPGQAKKLFIKGQRVPGAYRYSAYNTIPQQYRSLVPYEAANRYIYRDNQVYVVNPQTRLVTQIINLLR